MFLCNYNYYKINNIFYQLYYIIYNNISFSLNKMSDTIVQIKTPETHETPETPETPVTTETPE